MDLGGLYGLAIHLGLLLQFTLIHSFLLIFGGLFAAGAAGSGIPVTHAPSLWVPGLSEPVLPHSWRIEEVMVFQG